MPAHTNNVKRRRYIRYAIALEASLIVSESMSVPCTIQDFCSGGFFLSFKQNALDLDLAKIKQVKIHFSLSPEQGWQEFQLDAEIMHVSASGIGVAVENMPVSAFNALKNEANNGFKAVSFDRRSSASDKVNQDSCKKAIIKILDEQLPLLLTHFFDNFADELRNTKGLSADFRDISALEDVITTIKMNRETITSEFCSSILAEVNHISELKNKKEPEPDGDGKTLALVEKDDFEDWLNLSSVIRKLTKLHESRGVQIERKLSHVFGSPTHAIKSPISPGVICDNFRETILQYDLNNDIKKALYVIFENGLTSSLNVLFDLFDAALASFGASNQLMTDVIRQPDRPQSQAGSKDHRQTDKGPRIQPDHQTALISNDDLTKLLQIAEQKNTQPVAQVTKKLLELLKETNSASSGEVYNDKSAIKDAESLAQSFFTANEVAAAIATIQQKTNSQSNLHHNSLALQKLLQDTLEHSSAKPKTLATNDVKQLEVYGKLFETLFNDLKVSSDIKSYFESLHLTLLSLSMQGNDFLDSESHPARKVINQLATLESAVKGNKVIKKTNIKQALDKLVTRIAEEAGTNPNIFAEVEQELNEITEQVTKSVDMNIRRMVEAYEGQQKLETARHWVQQEIDRRIAGKSIAKIISDLLTSGWQHLLVITELNKENGNDDSSSYLRVIDDLMLWLSDLEINLDQHTDAITKTLHFIEDHLGSVCTNAFIHDSVLEELNAVLLGAGSPRVRKTPEMISIKPAINVDDHVAQTNGSKWFLQVEQLRVGEWLTVFRNSEGFQPMKLIWIGEFLPIFVFTDRDGLHKLELTKIELAELMQNGGANRIENLDVPLMDRATNTMLQKMHEKLIYNATHDPVTGLFTRDEFTKQLKHEKTTIGNSSHMLCQIVIQDFRLMTNIVGMEGGNQLLKKVTQTLTGRLRNDEILARLGDKSFGVLFKNCTSEEAYEIAKALLSLICDSHFEWEDKSYSIDISIGLVPFFENGYDVHQLMQKADSASNSKERSGQNRIRIFDDEDETLKRQYRLQEWVGQIDQVLSEDRLFLRCQRIASTESHTTGYSHYEILLGIRDKSGNFVPPDNFIPAVERCNRMPEIDQWVIRHAFAWIEQNRSFFDKIDGFSINLSGQSINKEEFLVFLKELLASCNLPTEKLTFEITETVAADSIVYVKKFIKQIKQFGCKFSLDDFGSGYSSYAYLKSLNVEYLKIDGAFIKDLANNNADIAIVKSMNEIAHSLNMKTIAEYVENNDILNILKDIGVDYVQGYGIQKPILLTDLINDPCFSDDFVIPEAHIGTPDDLIIPEERAGTVDDSNMPDEPVKATDDFIIPEDHTIATDNISMEDNDFWDF